MKIALLNDKFDKPGASSMLVALSAQELRRRGHQVTVITSHRTEEDPSVRQNGDVISLPISYRISLRHYLSVINPIASGLVAKIFDEHAPDVVHAHNVHTYLTWNALHIARKHTPRVFVTLHDVMSFAYGRLNSPRFLESGGTDCRLFPADHWQRVGLQYNPLRNVMIRRILRHDCMRCFPVSAALERALNTAGITNTTVIPNAIDFNRPNPDAPVIERFRATHGLQGKKVVLFGGRIGDDKGVVPLIAAMRRVIDAEPLAMLLIAGDAERWNDAVLRAKAQDIADRCKITGWLSTTDMRTAFACADAVTTPSLCLDTFNMMNVEAMAAGKPVVGTIFGGTPEVVEHGATGFVCDPRDTDAYAGFLLQLLQDDACAKRMGEAGRKRAEDRFSASAQADLLEQWYGRTA